MVRVGGYTVRAQSRASSHDEINTLACGYCARSEGLEPPTS
jgi:hypothetical protein